MVIDEMHNYSNKEEFLESCTSISACGTLLNIFHFLSFEKLRTLCLYVHL